MSANSSTPSPTSGFPSGDDDLADNDLTADLDLGFDGAEDLLRVWRQGLRPDPNLTVSEWADQHRWLSSRGAAEPGRYRTARAPYLREIMDALSPGHPAQRITFMKAAQVGATEAGNNWIGFVIHHAPGPMLAVLPSLELAKRTSRGRLDPLIADSPALRERVNPARSRDAGNSMLSKEFPGGILVLTGANATPEALQRWSAGARTVGIEQEKLADILKDVNDRVGDFLQTGGGPMADFFENVAPRVGVTADQFARLSGPEALQLYVDTLEQAGLSQQEMTFYLEAMASDATRLIPLLRNGGAEMARLGDQASDLGAVLDGDALEALRRTQLALGTVSLVFDGLRNRIAVAVAPTIEALANAFVALASDGGILRSAIDTLIGNLGRLTSYAATFAAVMAGRWVAGLAAAALSVRGLATALVFLRGALIRTGIGALIVGAGELVYQFSQLVARVGGVGEAFRLLGDLAREVWSRIGLSLDAALARMAAGWEGLKAAGLSALEGTIAGVVSFGDRTAAIFQGAYDAAVAIWGSLPGAIGDFAFQAANGLISGVEAMLNGVVTRINSFIETLNAALALLPEWATGEGGVRIGILDPVELGRIGNPFEGAATAAGAAAADAFSAALSRTYLEPPDLGLGAMAEDARARADGYREAAGMLADAAGRPLASWQALKDAVTGTGTEAETALADAAASADALTAGLNDTATAADSAGGAAREAGAAAAEGADTALTGWQAVTAALADYADKARDIGGDIGSALVGAFTSAENAIGDFVKTGKLDFRDLVTSMIADLAKLAARRFILGPIANALSGALGGAGGIFANILHAGGMVGAPGPGRMVPAMAFAGAPRMHSGGWAGLRPDEVPAILQRGERVLSRREAAGYGQAGASTVNVTINARDAESFRQSRTQVASDIARAVSLGRRGM